MAAEEQQQQQQAEMAGAIRMLQEQVLQLSGSLAQERQQAGQMERMMKMMESMAAEKKPPPMRLVDTRGIGKPPMFGGGDDKKEEKAYPVWQRKVANYVVSVYPDLKEALEWAVHQAEPIGPMEIQNRFGHQADELDRIQEVEDKLHQLYSILVQITEGEANDIVCNSSGQGLEAWRKLARRYDPLTGGRIRNLLRFIINPGRCTLNDLQGALERWEEQVNKYTSSQDKSGKRRELPEDIKMAALESLVPSDLENHLQMNATKFEDYLTMRTEVIRYVEAKAGAKVKDVKIQQHDKTRDGDPMDVDALMKGKGSGKGSFSDGCYNCGKPGHMARDCWQPPGKGKAKGGGKAKESWRQNVNASSAGNWQSPGKAKGKGKDDPKGKGKGKGSYYRAAGACEQDDKMPPEDAWNEGDWWQTHPAEPEAEHAERKKEVGGLGLGSLDAGSVDIGSFKTASGEIIPDEGAVRINGYLENGTPCYIPGRRAGVHKPLVSASRWGKKGMFMMMDGHGGTVIDDGSRLAQKIKKLIKEEFDRNPKEELVRLYLENGVYNFYVQNEDFSWTRYNLDSGAAETVFPIESMDETSSAEEEEEGRKLGGIWQAPRL